MVYQPREDSYLLLEQVKRFSKGLVLDIGTGTGILALEAAKKAKKVVAADINAEAVAVIADKIKKDKIRNIKVIKSDLFKNIKKQRFDLIIFNPPYLPQDKGLADKEIYGGEKGYELTERFLSGAGNYLKEKGIILLLFSSLTNKGKVDGIVEDYCFGKELLAARKLFFEELFVYRIEKSQLLQLLTKKRIKSVKRFAKGHRGIIYVGKLNNRKVAVKAQRRDTAAKGTVNNESKWLKILNAHGIGPKLLFAGNDYFCYEFVEGKFVIDFITTASKKNTVKIINAVLKQCYQLDKLGINKEEMHKPVKHVIVTKKLKPVLVDFERTKKTRKPHNVTQFCQFLISKNFGQRLKEKGIIVEKEKMIELAKVYKSNVNDENFSKLLALLG